jgi:hypothetical protein
MVRWKDVSGYFTGRSVSLLGCLLGGSLLLVMRGCGSSATQSDRLPVYPATGRVEYSGGPVGGAFVVFHPRGASEKGAPHPHGQVKSDGSYLLTSYESDDGAPAGDYDVTVELRRLVNHGGDISAGPNVLPPKYGRPDSSPVKVRIAEGTNELPAIQIKK